MAAAAGAHVVVGRPRLARRGTPGIALVPFLLVILLLDVSAMLRLSPTHDEAAHVAFGKSVVDREPGTVPMQKMAVSALNYLPTRWLGGPVSDPTTVFLYRLPTVFASLVLVTLVFVWSSRLYGLLGALMSAALYAFCPNLLAHSQLATNDLFCACLMFASTLLFVRYLDAPTWSAALLCAAATGLAQVTKHTALLLFPVFAALWILAVVRARRWSRPDLVRAVAHGALGVLVVAVIVNAAYLFHDNRVPAGVYLAEYRAWPREIRTNPLLELGATLATRVSGVPVPMPSAWVRALFSGVYLNATGLGHGPVYLLGQLSPSGWRHYFLVALVLKTPLAVLLLAAVAALLSAPWLRRRPLDEAALLLAPAVILVFFSFFCTAQIGIRYLLPMLPFAFVAMGKVAAHVPARHVVPYRCAVGALLLWGALSSLSFHPYYLSYSNELIGDRKNMFRYLADSNVDWGQCTDELARYLASDEGRGAAVNPESPTRGRVVVNVNSLVGVSGSADRYRWLREGFEPVAHVCHAWLVYEVPDS
jgi:4-amino-4-deoxy-L-arabinose transferase-like glycosyltransferase